MTSPKKNSQRLPLGRRIEFFLIACSQRGSHLLTSLSDGWEWFFQRGLQALLAFIGRGLARVVPRRAVLAVLTAGRTVSSWLAMIVQRIAAGIASVAQRVLPAGCIRWLAWAWYLMVTAYQLCARFAHGWWASREWKRLLWAIPAMLLAAPLITCIVISPLYSKSSKMAHYQRAMNAALKSEDQALAELCVMKLNQLGFQRMEKTKYHAALLLAEDEKYEQAYEQMLEVAPVDTPGYAPAHAWIAANLITGKLHEDDHWERIELHVHHALAVEPDYPLGRRLLIEVQLHKNHMRAAFEEMLSLIEYFPELNSPLMNFYLANHDLPTAKACARAAASYYEATLNKGEQPLRAEDYVRWVEALSLLGEADRSAEVLESGYAQYPQDDPLRAKLLETVLARADKLLTAGINPDSVAPLFQAFAIAPDNQDVLTKLADLLAHGNATVRTFVQQRRASIPPELMLLAGDYRVHQADFAGAVEYYREACELDPESGRGWNNIAWIQANIDPIDLEAALAAADRAVAVGDPRYLETRGQILVKLQRWEEAVRDLELALNGDVPNRSDVHRSLALAYEQLGQAEKAGAHRRLLDGS